jgi:hypothetical protein
MRCFHRMLRALGTRSGGTETHGPVILKYGPTGGYLAPGARLVTEAHDAIAFASPANALAMAGQFACEPGSFVTVAAPSRLTSVSAA